MENVIKVSLYKYKILCYVGGSKDISILNFYKNNVMAKRRKVNPVKAQAQVPQMAGNEQQLQSQPIIVNIENKSAGSKFNKILIVICIALALLVAKDFFNFDLSLKHFMPGNAFGLPEVKEFCGAFLPEGEDKPSAYKEVLMFEKEKAKLEEAAIEREVTLKKELLEKYENLLSLVGGDHGTPEVGGTAAISGRGLAEGDTIQVQEEISVGEPWPSWISPVAAVDSEFRGSGYLDDRAVAKMRLENGVEIILMSSHLLELVKVGGIYDPRLRSTKENFQAEDGIYLADAFMMCDAGVKMEPFAEEVIETQTYTDWLSDTK